MNSKLSTWFGPRGIAPSLLSTALIFSGLSGGLSSLVGCVGDFDPTPSSQLHATAAAAAAAASPSPSPVGAATGFSITAKGTTSAVQYATHVFTPAFPVDPLDYVKPCTILPTDPSTDLVCVVEAEELALYFQGVNLITNVAPSMCEYTQFTPYYYFVNQPGTGPAALTETVDTAGHSTFAGASPSNCSFDYTSSGGPNCCMGGYTVTRTTNLAGPPASSVVDTYSGSYGGKAANCLAGPGVDSQPKSTLTGEPVPTLGYTAGVGAVIKYPVTSPLSRGLQSNVYAANYHLASDHAVPSQLPISLGFSGIGVGLIRNPSPYFEYDCLDRAFTVQHRIRVMVREWDEQAQLNVLSGGFAGANPDSGFGGGNDAFGVPLNFFKDWKDFDQTFPASNQ